MKIARPIGVRLSGGADLSAARRGRRAHGIGRGRMAHLEPGALRAQLHDAEAVAVLAPRATSRPSPRPARSLRLRSQNHAQVIEPARNSAKVYIMHIELESAPGVEFDRSRPDLRDSGRIAAPAHLWRAPIC